MIDAMKAVSAAALAALMIRVCSGQVTSPPPVCFAFNDGFAGAPTFPSQGVPYFGNLTVHFTAPVNAVVERIDLYSWTYIFSNPLLTIDVHATSGLGVPPTGPSLGQFGSPNNANIWVSFQAVPAVAVTAGATYVLVFQGYPSVPNSSQYPNVCVPVYFDPAGPTQLPYQLVSTPACPQSIAPGSVGLIIRFRGTGCGPGPLATVSSIGPSCGATTYSPIFLVPTAPVLGSQWSVWLLGPLGETAMLFWSGGVNLLGSPISLGSTCRYYLDPVSVASLAQMGAEPLVTTTLIVGGNPLTFPVPPFPIYAGLVIGVQAIVVGPTGTIPLGGGVFAQTSNALQLTLGY
jgi:hypothetical protein